MKALSGNVKALSGFTLSFMLPSTGIMQQCFGVAGAVGYVILASCVMVAIYKDGAKRIIFWLDKRNRFLIYAITMAFIIAVFLLLYPHINSHLPGKGSDRDDALNIAVTELLKGNYPYYQKTYLENPISPLPGAIFLSIPFVLVGNSAYQNIFWLFAFLLTMCTNLGDWRNAVLLLWILLSLSPIVQHEIISGGDLLANGLYVLVFVVWHYWSVIKSGYNCYTRILTSSALGIGLSSRANFILIVPVIFFMMIKEVPIKSAIKYMLITFLVLLLTTMPFYFYDPLNFSPLHTASKLGQFDLILPYSEYVIPIVTFIIACCLGIFCKRNNISELLRNCAFVLAFPVLCGTVLQSLHSGRVELGFTGYGLSFLFFGAASFWPELFHRSVEADFCK
jgi:hypothetical protein